MMAGDCLPRYYSIGYEEWVAVKDKLFEDPSVRIKLLFIVAYNECEGKIAITCREHHRNFKNDEVNVRAGIFSFNDLRYIHKQLSLIHPSLEGHLPSLPYEPQGLWALFYTLEIPPTLCLDIENYLQIALEICGQELLLLLLFSEDSVERYFEDLSELKITGYECAVTQAEEELEKVLHLRSVSGNLLSLTEVYKMEDQAVNTLSLALAELYNFQIQPFLDLRELSYCKLREAKFQMNNPDVGKRVKSHYAKQFLEWKEQYTKAVDHILELYVKYFTSRVDIVSAQCERMMIDRSMFGKSAFALCALSRLQSLEEQHSQERLQMLHTIKQLQEHKREISKQQLASINSHGKNVVGKIEQIEVDVYKLQIKLYDVKMKILEEEEILAKKQLNLIQRDIEGNDCDVIFHDAVENLEDLSPDEDASADPRIVCLKQKLAVIFRKRAQLRNLKKACIAAWETKTHLKHEEKIASLKPKKGDPIEMVKNQERIQDERRKTLQRLREFKTVIIKMKYPSTNCLNADPPTSSTHPKKNKSVHKRTISTNLVQQTDHTSSSALNIQAVDPPQDLELSSTICQVNEQIFSAKNCHLNLDNTLAAVVTSSTSVATFSAPQIPPPPPPPLPPPPPPLPPPPPPPNTVNTPIKKVEPVKKILKDKPFVVNADEIVNMKKRLKQPNKDYEKNLRKEDVMDEMLQMIRLGVKLRKVEASPTTRPPTPTEGSCEQLLQDALNRIRTFTEDSDKSDDENPSDFD